MQFSFIVTSTVLSHLSKSAIAYDVLCKLKAIIDQQMLELDDPNGNLLSASGVWLCSASSASARTTSSSNDEEKVSTKLDYRKLSADLLDLMASQLQTIREIFEAYLPKLPRMIRPTNHSSSRGLIPRERPQELQLLPSSARGLTFDGFLTFAKDFEIYPQLANKTELKSLWQDVRAQDAENSNSLVMSLFQVRRLARHRRPLSSDL
jgi:hypothetical protein